MLQIHAEADSQLLIQAEESKAAGGDACHIIPLCAAGYRNWCALVVLAQWVIWPGQAFAYYLRSVVSY